MLKCEYQAFTQFRLFSGSLYSFQAVSAAAPTLLKQSQQSQLAGSLSSNLSPRSLSTYSKKKPNSMYVAAKGSNLVDCFHTVAAKGPNLVAC